jgi:hypothetical protein
VRISVCAFDDKAVVARNASRHAVVATKK